MGTMSEEIRLVVCTFPSTDEAVRIGRDLVKGRLAACVNVIPGVRSIYSWEGKLCDDKEVVVLIKTTSALFEDVRTRVVELHPYDCPEVIALTIDAGHVPYLDWVAQSVGEPIE